MTLHDDEAGLSLLQCSLHPLYHRLYSFNSGRHTRTKKLSGRNRVVTTVKKEWQKSRGHIDCIIGSKFCQGQLLDPVSRMSFYIGSQEVLQRLDHPLRLPISLRVKHNTEPQIGSQQVKKTSPKSAGEPWVTI